jgi:hypothetical protein
MKVTVCVSVYAGLLPVINTVEGGPDEGWAEGLNWLDAMAASHNTEVQGDRTGGTIAFVRGKDAQFVISKRLVWEPQWPEGIKRRPFGYTCGECKQAYNECVCPRMEEIVCTGDAARGGV